MNENLCEIVVLLDRSCSMQAVKSDMEGGFNAFVDEQRKVPGECLLTLTQFDSEGIEAVHEAKPIKDVPPLVFQPRGNTPLLDALGKTIRDVGARLAATAEDKRPGKVLFLVITDGQENASKEFTKPAIKALVEEQTNKWKWQFVFLGANVDAFGEAGALGIRAASNYTSSPVGTRRMMAMATLDVRSARMVKDHKLGASLGKNI